jgi:hypothetical protein
MGSKSLTRSRWAAIGAAVAVTLGGGGLIGVSAATSTDPATFTPVDPVRVLDTRSPLWTDADVKGARTHESTTILKVTGPIETLTNEIVTATPVPAGATAIQATLTLDGHRKYSNGYGFVTAYGCAAATDAPPNASTINMNDGGAVANSTVIPVDSSGNICLNVYGTTDLILDITGFYSKAVDAYSKTQSDSRYFSKSDALFKADAADAFPRNPVVYAYGNSLFNGLSTNEADNQGMIPSGGRATNYKTGAQGASQSYVLPLIGPMRAGDSNHEYSPYDVEVCFGAFSGITSVELAIRTSADHSDPFIGDTLTVTSIITDKCHTIEISEDDLIDQFGDTRTKTFILNMKVNGGDSAYANVNSVEATWWDQYNAPR